MLRSPQTQEILNHAYDTYDMYTHGMSVALMRTAYLVPALCQMCVYILQVGMIFSYISFYLK